MPDNGASDGHYPNIECSGIRSWKVQGSDDILVEFIKAANPAITVKYNMNLLYNITSPVEKRQISGRLVP